MATYPSRHVPIIRRIAARSAYPHSESKQHRDIERSNFFSKDVIHTHILIADFVLVDNCGYASYAGANYYRRITVGRRIRPQ